MDSAFSPSESGDFVVTRNVQDAFDDNGYIIVRKLLSPEEMTKLKDCVETSADIQKNAFGRKDIHGRLSKLSLWNYAGNDVTGVVARIQKVAGTMQDLLGGD
eukprot:maker-scaffold18_size714446-snap-gene-1.19 protein:Tk08453 transcript:maker-scaffold18_size714446-snap-gene-1.19-mRNA-1 annotation:"hypothetical protein BRAFLDRAFT_71485"